MDKAEAESLCRVLQGIDGLLDELKVRAVPTSTAGEYRVVIASPAAVHSSYVPEAFRTACTRYDFVPEKIWHRQFDSGGERYRVVSLNTKASKYPVGAERLSDGAQSKFSHLLFAECKGGV